MSAFAPDRDVEVVAAHAAPVLLRPRTRTVTVPRLGFVRMRTPSRIRYVPPGALAERVRPPGAYDGGLEPEGLALFEGRLWRPLPVGRNWAGDRRSLVWDLFLDPVVPGDCSGALSPIRPVEPEPGAVVLDLTAETASAMARRVSERLLHDGTRAWQSLPTPLIVVREGRPETVVVRAAPWPRHEEHPGTLPDGIGDFIHYARRGHRSFQRTRRLIEAIHETAERYERDLAGLEPTPRADLSWSLRVLVLRSAIAARRAAGLHPAAAEAVGPALPEMTALLARASVDLLPDAELERAAERIGACARAVLSAVNPANLRSRPLATLADAADYVRLVAQPRFPGGAGPSPEDAEHLGGLAP